MCGIAGIIQTDTSLHQQEHIKNMTDALSHRGPDGQGQWQNESATALLGHRRLSIIDLTDAGHQPMLYLNKYTIVHNGEIYNYIELKEELQKKGYHFHSKTDTEVIAAAYDCWKYDCVTHFDGMFAFAIWDESEKELFAARDRFGEKPFFYFRDNQRFIFGSEMKALWAAGVPKQFNQKMLFNFLTIGYLDNPAIPEETFYHTIQKLPPASRLCYTIPENELLIEKYWQLDTSFQQKKLTDEDAIEKFSHLLSDSIKKRLRSDVPVGTSLSGGLDSSSIAALINENNKGTFQHDCFTATFPGFEKDESQYATLIADSFHLTQHQINVSEEQLLADWDKLCFHHEAPFGSASVYAQYKVFELAKQQQVKVLLDGQGADETLAGYSKYYKWYWQELFRNRKLYRSKELAAARELGITESFDYKNMIAAYFPDFATIVMEQRYLLKAIKQEDLTKDFIQQQSKEAYYSIPERFTLNSALHFNTCVHGLEELLRYADRNAMAHGREVRLPFLSHELVEFIFSLPAQFKIRKGWTKWLLRTTMADKLPEAITWRKDKVGFEPPQKKWMQNSDVQDAIQTARKKLVTEKILEPAVLKKPIQSLNSHDANNYDWRYFAAANFI